MSDRLQRYHASPQDGVELYLHDYQRTGVEWLTGPGLNGRKGLGDAMGLGKTIQAIAALDDVGAKRVTILCPAVARVNWRRELARWSRVPHNCMVESYDMVARNSGDLRRELERFNPDVLILDECDYLKTPTTKRTNAVYTALTDTPRYVWPMSGTIARNHAGELYTHFAALWPEYPESLGIYNYDSWIEWFCTYTYRAFNSRMRPQRVITGLNLANAGVLKGWLDKVLLRRRVDEVHDDLPPLTWGTYVVDRMKGDAALNEALEVLASYEQADRDPSLDTNGAHMMQLVGMAKVKAAVKLIADEISRGEYRKIVVFAYHRAVLDGLQAGLSALPVYRIDGSTPDSIRNQHIDTFQSADGPAIFLGQYRACGTAINLNASSQVLFVESSFTPSDNSQAAHRCYRAAAGITEPVFVRVMGLADSYDERRARSCARKARDLSTLELL